MERTLNIDGRQVRFKSTGAFLLRYKAQFGRDAVRDLMKLSQVTDPETGEINQIDTLDLDVFFNLAWTLAKTADPDIPDPLTWLDSFEAFPLMEILPELQDLLLASIQGSKKK